jgi:hypothetical protein
MMHLSYRYTNYSIEPLTRGKATVFTRTPCRISDMSDIQQSKRLPPRPPGVVRHLFASPQASPR